MKTKYFEPVLAWLDAGAPHTAGKGFNMNQFWLAAGGMSDFNNSPCGTAMCIAGAIADFNGLSGLIDDGDPLEVGRHIGLTEEQSYILFFAGNHSCGDLLRETDFKHLTPAMAAHAIRTLIATGTPEWDESLTQPVFPSASSDESRRRKSNKRSPTVKNIDVTPSWEEILPALLLLLEKGTPEAARTAKSELRRMARLADLHVNSVKDFQP